MLLQILDIKFIRPEIKAKCGIMCGVKYWVSVNPKFNNLTPISIVPLILLPTDIARLF